jgi:hypothetical protein
LSVAHQLVDEERAAAGLADDFVGASCRLAVARADQGERQLARVWRSQLPHNHFSRPDRRQRAGIGPQQPAQQHACLSLVRSITGDEQQYRWFGGAQHVGQQGGTVGVAPLQVVDEQHQRLTFADARQERTERGKSAAPEFLRVRNFTARFSDLRDGVHAQQRGKEPR